MSRSLCSLGIPAKDAKHILWSETILNVWRDHHPHLQHAIGRLRGMVKYRHWLAHGRWFTPSFGRADGGYPFDEVYDLVSALLHELGLKAAADFERHPCGIA